MKSTMNLSNKVSMNLPYMCMENEMEGSPGLQDVKKLKHVGCVWTRVVVKPRTKSAN